MNILRLVVAITVSCLLYWQQFSWLYILVGGIAALVVMFLITHRSSSPKIEEGVQIVVPSEKIGTHLGSDESPFGSVRSEQ